MKNLEKMKIFEKTIKMDNESNEMIDFKLISEKEFREVTKGCGIKYRNKIPSREFKAMLGYRPLNNMMVEIRDKEGNCKIFDNMRRAAIENGLSDSSVIKYAIDLGRSYMKRKSDKKEFFCERDLTTRSLFSMLKWIKHMSTRKGAGPYSRDYLTRSE